MKCSFFLISILFSFCTSASNFYVNPSSDSTNEKGNITNPWKSIAAVNANMAHFKAGDTVFIKRGELYFDRLEIKCSGFEKAPVVFSPYGSAVARPVFLFKSSDVSGGINYNMIRLIGCKYVVLDGFEITDDTMDPLDRDHTANIAVAINIDRSDFIILKNLKISLVGIGVNIQGSKNTIDSCSFENLRMIKNTVGGDDDYGANPVVIAGPNNTVSNCFFKDCWANSFDYTYDGGAIEMFGATSDNTKIINNTAINCDGFMEIGSLDEGSNDNTLISHNTIINCGELIYISTGGKYKIGISNLMIYNNIIIHTFNQLTHPTSMIGLQTPLTQKGIIIMKDNIFWLTSGIDVGRRSQFLAGQLIHQHNLYYMSSGTLNYPPDPSESIIKKDSPILKKIASMHPDLADMDLFPFIYLVNVIIGFFR